MRALSYLKPRNRRLTHIETAGKIGLRRRAVGKSFEHVAFNAP
jgi:hypothetical protein